MRLSPESVSRVYMKCAAKGIPGEKDCLIMPGINMPIHNLNLKIAKEEKYTIADLLNQLGSEDWVKNNFTYFEDATIDADGNQWTDDLDDVERLFLLAAASGTGFFSGMQFPDDINPMLISGLQEEKEKNEVVILDFFPPVLVA